MRDVIHPCYCVIYEENNNLQNLQIEISSDWPLSWSNWNSLEPSDWDSLNFSIPHFYIIPPGTFVTYKNNQEVSTTSDSYMNFLSADANFSGTYYIMCVFGQTLVNTVYLLAKYILVCIHLIGNIKKTIFYYNCILLPSFSMCHRKLSSVSIFGEMLYYICIIFK